MKKQGPTYPWQAYSRVDSQQPAVVSVQWQVGEKGDVALIKSNSGKS